MHDHCEHFQVTLNSLHKTVIKESPLVGLPKVERQLTQWFEKIIRYAFILLFYFGKTRRGQTLLFSLKLNEAMSKSVMIMLPLFMRTCNTKFYSISTLIGSKLI